MADFLGIVSAEFEVGYPSGNAGTISSGVGDYGGISYGIPQFSSTTGSAKDFATWLNTKVGSPTTARLASATPGAAAFGQYWKDIHAELGEDKFALYQNLKIMESFYKVFAANVKSDTGVDVNSDRALQEMAFSTSVHYGPYTTVVKNSGVTGAMSVSTIINKIYDYKISSVYSYFGSSSAAVQEGVKNRFYREKARVLEFVGKPPQPTDPGQIGQVVDNAASPGDATSVDKKGTGKFIQNGGFLETTYAKDYVLSNLDEITPLQALTKECVISPAYTTTLGATKTDTISDIARQGTYIVNNTPIQYRATVSFYNGLELYFAIFKRCAITSIKLYITRSASDKSSEQYVSPKITNLPTGMTFPALAKGQTGSMSIAMAQFTTDLITDKKPIILYLDQTAKPGQFENFVIRATLRIDLTKFGLEGH